MPKNVSKSDYIRSTLALPARQLKDIRNMVTNRRLASRLLKASKIMLGDLKVRLAGKKRGEGFVKFRYRGRQLMFYYDSGRRLAETLGMIMDEFIKGESNKMDVKGKDVVDIGAYVADTAICYISNGARHVYAFEPFPYFYRTGIININANRLEGKITMINAACGGESSTAPINESSTNFTIINAESPKKRKGRISVMSLGQIIKMYKIKNAVLKIDCEGCEYEIISKAGRNVLRKFSEIQVEYHYGYKNIEERLREMGFDVRLTKPVKKYNFATNSFMTIGFINARIRRGKDGQ